MSDPLFAEAVRAAGTRMGIATQPWWPVRAAEVDTLVRLAAAEEVEVARQRRIGRYSPRGLSEPPGRTLRRSILKEPSKGVAVHMAVIEVIGLGWFAAAGERDEGYCEHPPESLWNAWTVHFISNTVLDGVDWAASGRAIAASIWRERLVAAGLWRLRGRARQRFLASIYFGAGVMLHVLQRSSDIGSPMVLMTAKWPMRQLPLVGGPQ